MTTRGLSIGFVLLLLANAGMRAAIALQPYERPPLNTPVDSDAFYYFNIARNVIAGHGITHDRTVPTNGFQPLYGFVIVPLFAAAPDRFTAINYALLLGCAIYVAAALLLRRVLSLSFGAVPATLAAMLWVASPMTTRHVLNGMETGLSATLCLLALYGYFSRVRAQEPERLSWAAALIAGALVGLLYLARFDNVVFVALLAADYLWLHRSRWKTLLSPRMAGLAAAAALVASPWVLYCVLGFGALMPKSGEASRLIAEYTAGRPSAEQLPRTFGAAAVSGFVRSEPVLGTALLVSDRLAGGATPAPLLAAFVAAGLLVLTGALRRPLAAGAPTLGVLLLAYVAILFVVYPLFMPVRWYFTRYFVLFGVAFAYAYAAWLGGLIGGAASRARLAVAVFGAAAASVLLTAANAHYVLRLTPAVKYQRAIDWLQAHTRPERDVIGIFQADVVPYYIDNAFLNLDGKCNVRALEAMKDGRMFDFIREQRIAYVVDRSDVVEALLFRRSGAIPAGALTLVERYEADQQEWRLYRVNGSN